MYSPPRSTARPRRAGLTTEWGWAPAPAGRQARVRPRLLPVVSILVPDAEAPSALERTFRRRWDVEAELVGGEPIRVVAFVVRELHVIADLDSGVSYLEAGVGGPAGVRPEQEVRGHADAVGQPHVAPAHRRDCDEGVGRPHPRAPGSELCILLVLGRGRVEAAVDADPRSPFLGGVGLAVDGNTEQVARGHAARNRHPAPQLA